MRVQLFLVVALCMGHIALAQNPILDLSFDPGAGSNEFLMAVAIQDDGRIIVGGRFTSFQGFPRIGVVRLLPDGMLDLSFGPVPLSSVHEIHALAIDAAGRILIGGYFYGFDGTAMNCIARLNPDGTRDLSFNPGTGANYTVDEIIPMPNGRILVGGSFITVNGVGRRGVALLDSDGSLDPGFDLGTGFSASFDPAYPYVNSLALDQEGRVLVGGSFDSFNGALTGPLVRLSTEGVLDVSFAPVLDPWDSELVDILVLPDQRIRIAGTFNGLNGQSQGGIAGLLPDGTTDPMFVQGPEIVQNVGQLVKDGDGILIAGGFNTYQGTDRHQLLRTDANGALDLGFNIGTGFEGAFPYVNSMARQYDSKVLIVGNFEFYNGIERIDVLRLGVSTDCLGIIGGTAFPGTPCDDGIFFTSDDTWTLECDCSGFDCAGTQGGNALPGAPCDDGVSWTYNDVWNTSCLCTGTGMVGMAESMNTATELFLWPYPAHSNDVRIGLKLPASTSAQVEVRDAAGRVFWSQQMTAKGNLPVELHTPGLSAGVHLVSVVSEHGSFVRRLVVH